MSAKHTPGPKARAVKGLPLNDDGLCWGVIVGGAVLYECMFSEADARDLARLENSPTPPTDWHAASAALAKARGES